ncbi:PD-(D/E)XK nuclease-like domain-containing protein [Lysinibacillus sphaericus]|uniref:PD-(D/E)XK nuclease-like domain-containing protein n=1 Tax=Lysinibacillus sphaericus TaxID=1421 RepID=UPI0018CD3F7E|nr:PD-(D/E)XK nuclease-like domain-containing protein [Lysinibacillus sphaericus]
MIEVAVEATKALANFIAVTTEHLVKSTQELRKRYWSEKYHTWVSFVQAFDYVLQMWVYKEIIFQNTGRYMIYTLWQLQKNRHPIKPFYTSIQDVSTLRKNMFNRCKHHRCKARAQKCTSM